MSFKSHEEFQYRLSLPLITVNGYCWPHGHDEASIRDMPQFRLRDDDVIVSSAYRQGTHWATELTDLVMNNGDVTYTRNTPFLDRVTWLDITKEFWLGTFNAFSQGEQPVKALDRATALPTDKPRVMVTHVGYPFMPTQLKQGKGKAVVVLRNPKSTFVSEWHLWKTIDEMFKGRPPTMDEVLDGQLQEATNTVLNSPWWDFLKQWFQHRHELPNVYFLKYEDMIKDMPRVIKDLAKFFNKDIPQSKIQAMTKYLSFEEMADCCTTNDHLGHMQGFTRASKAHMRKGKIENWKTHMTVAQSERVDTFFKDRLVTLGISFENT